MSSDAPSTSAGARTALVALALCALLFTLLYALRGVQQVDDSMSYAVSIKTGWRLYHPHHLLFGPIVRSLWAPLSGHVDAIGATQIHNALWAAVAVTALLVLVRRATGSLALASGASLLLLAAYGFLTYCLQVEVYVPAAACFTLAVVVLTRGDEAGAGDRPSGAGLSFVRLALAAALLSLAIFYHQPNVLLCAPLVLFFAVCPGPGGLRSGVRAALIVIGGAGALVLSVYIAAYAVEVDQVSASGFVDHVLRYATAEDTTRDWGTMENVSAEGVRELLESQLVGFVTPQRSAIAGAAWGLGVAIALLVLWNTLRAALSGSARGMRCLLLGWLGVDYAFFLWWQPFQPEFFIATLVPLVSLGTLTAADLLRGRSARSVAAALLAVAAVVLLVDNLRELRTRVGTMGREAGEAYLSLVPRDCVHLGYRNLVQTLRYEFDVDLERSHNISQARRRALGGEDVQGGFPLSAEDCVVVPGNEVLPRGKRDDPRARLAFYGWLFRLAPIDGGVRGPRVTAVSAGGGPFYLLQGPSTERYEDLAAFFAEVDAALGGRAGGDAFSRWFRANASGLSLQD